MTLFLRLIVDLKLIIFITFLFIPSDKRQNIEDSESGVPSADYVTRGSYILIFIILFHSYSYLSIIIIKKIK